MKKVEINKNNYEVVKEYKNGLDLESLKEKCKETDYFDAYDYILGDWAYGKLRLKGFYESKSKNCNNSNDYNNIDKYIKEYCAYECKYFILKKL